METTTTGVSPVRENIRLKIEKIADSDAKHCGLRD